MYPTTKVKGIIELGAAPIRFCAQLRNSVRTSLLYSRDALWKEADIIDKNDRDHLVEIKKKGVVFLPYKNKYQTILLMSLVQSK